MSRKEPTQEPPYYTLDTSLFQGILRYFSREREPVLVRGKIHLSEEAYRLQPAERSIEPIEHLKGTRSYIHLKPYVQIPDIRITIGLYRQPTEQGAIGEVLSSQEKPRLKEIEIGQAQAWYYPQDRMIIEVRLSETPVIHAGDEKVFLSWGLGRVVKPPS